MKSDNLTHGLYKSVVDPVSNKKWIVCMENLTEDPVYHHPIYINNDDTKSTLSVKDAQSIRDAINHAFDFIDDSEYRWYLTWYTKLSDDDQETDPNGELIGEIYLKDMTDDDARQIFSIGDEDMKGRYAIDDQAVATDVARFSGYRYSGGQYIPCPYVINISKYDYLLYPSKR